MRHILFALLFAMPLTAQQSGYITTSDSGRIYYRVAGRGTDTIVAIHGGPGLDMESIYRDFVAGLAAHHTVIFYDQRGGGKSELPSDTTRLRAARQVQDLEEVRQHFGLRRLTLVAHSYGPLLAGSYAVAHPENVERMVFFGPVPPRRGDFWTRFSASLTPRMTAEQRWRMSAAARIMTDPKSNPDAIRQACRDYWAVGMLPRLAEPGRTLPLVKSDLCATDTQGIRYGNQIGNRVIMGSYGNWDLRPQLATLNVPLLVVHGEQESIPMDLVEEWVTSMPAGRGTLLKVPGAAHFTYAEQPDVVWPAVEKFLSVTQGRGAP
ncbi:MAG TPA: alpha/beta fold hydrolase [Gemmatimonadaceae bacterium]|jgi:proline iminopeptidase|nr:alpha/beta fold hydrolase [Gemmatimonadaceae bacterium]